MKFQTRDGKWSVETAWLSMVSPPSDTTHWGDPAHGDGLYLRAQQLFGSHIVFYAGSSEKAQDKHLQGCWAELIGADLPEFDIEQLESIETMVIPTRLAAEAAAAITKLGSKAPKALTELLGRLEEVAA